MCGLHPEWKHNRMNIFSVVCYDTQDFQIPFSTLIEFAGDQIAKSVDFTNRSFNEMSFWSVMNLI